MSAQELATIFAMTATMLGFIVRQAILFASMQKTINILKDRNARLEVRVEKVERYLGNKYKFWKDTEPPDVNY